MKHLCINANEQLQIFITTGDVLRGVTQRIPAPKLLKAD